MAEAEALLASNEKALAEQVGGEGEGGYGEPWGGRGGYGVAAGEIEKGGGEKKALAE